MNEVIVLAEHRQGKIRDITWEMLSKGSDIASQLGTKLGVVLLGKDVDSLVTLLNGKANSIFLVRHESLEHFDPEAYEMVIAKIISETKPLVTLIGHTATGMDLAPALAARLGISIATDCISVTLEGRRVLLTREMYGGKVNARISFLKDYPYLITVRAGAFPIVNKPPVPTEIVSIAFAPPTGELRRKFVRYIEATPGADLEGAEIVVGIGRGIGDPANIPVIQEFADALGAALACSRPVVDKKWLPKDRQIGTSGRTIKPKLYIALGISGAFHHVAGIKASTTIIAVNKDPKAPIFGRAHYGVVGDIFKIVPVLTEKMMEKKKK